MKALIVDDDEVVRVVMKEILISLGYDVLEAKNIKQAKQCLATCTDLDLMTLDSTLDHQSGTGFLAELREMPKHIEKPKVVMVSCENSMDSILGALAAGAVEYIMKPFDKDIVREKLGMIGMFHAEVSDIEEKTCH